MPEDPDARDQRTFAPRPERIWLALPHGAPVETALYNFLDLPGKDAQTVWGLENELRAAPTSDWPELIATLQRIVRLFCPALEDAHLEALSINVMQRVIAAAHGAADPPPAPEAAAPASRSASGPSTTLSP